ALVRTASMPGSENTLEYAKLRTQLQRIRDFNRRKDVWIADIFTLIPAPQNSKYVEYGVDAEEVFPYGRRFGEIYTRAGQPLTIGIEGINRLADNLESFQAGFHAAFAPIRDASGTLVAMLGVRLSPAPSSVLDEIGAAMLAPFVVTVVLALVLAAILAR